MVIVTPFLKLRAALARRLTHDVSVTSVGSVDTDRGDRYARQLASHLGRKASAVWDEHSRVGTITFDSAAHVVLTTSPEALTCTLVCPRARVDELRDVVERHLVRFGAREGLTVRWETLRP